ncbi:MAG TPA: SurA N-terminal domain-containing protein [Pyrinomonadaceae bacterium]|nr:SurA N-terminal domain-containing protein [Pyrinomonadaceae bacterium]
MRKQISFIGLAGILLGALAIAGCSSGPESADNTVAATVNGKKIMSQEVERIIHQQSDGKESQMSAHDLAQARLTVLDKLIQREVLFQRAEQEKVLPSEDEITNFINKQKQDSRMSEEEFARQLKEQNLSMEALREESKKDLAVQKLQDKYTGKVTISDREIEDYYNSNKQVFVNARGAGLAVIIVDPADNSNQGIMDDAKNDADAKAKIDGIYQQLKSGTSDFATVARSKSEDANSMIKGGDIGFFSEDGMKQAGLPKDVVDQLMGPMQNGNFTEPKLINNRWYILKLQEKRLATENLTLESPNVRQQINAALTEQRKNILNAALLEVALSEAKIVNSFAANMLANPSNLGLRPASANAANPPASTTAATPASSPAAAAKASPSAAASPAKK